MLTKENVLVVVPAYNEEASLAQVLRDLLAGGFETVVVSDGSRDRTALIARSFGIDVLELPVNLGVGGALRAGFKFARLGGFRAVVQVDADGQHPIDKIESLISVANESGAHMVIGSRFAGEDLRMAVSPVRRVAMWVLSRSASSATGTTITDSTSGFRIITEPLLEQFAHHFANNYLGDTYEAVVSAGRAGYSVVEIPAQLSERTHGESTASVGSAIRFTLKGLGVAFLRLHKPLIRCGSPTL